jgi:ligand-binding sensor domain-containing protein/two-component sensor histidine kinase
MIYEPTAAASFFLQAIHSLFLSFHLSYRQFMTVKSQFVTSLVIFGITSGSVLKKHWLYIFYFLLLAITAAGQGARQYTFTHYGVSSGLASNEATVSLQDDKGFIWVATNNGLQRFDGQRYLSFRHEKDDPTTIPHNYIVQLLLDKKKNLWLLTGDGKVGTFDMQTFTYQQATVKVKDTGILNGDRELIQDEQGNLFLLFHNSELVTWNPQQKEFSSIHNFINLPAEWKIADLIQQPGTKKYWIGRREGIAVYNLETKQLSYSGHNIEKEPLIEKWGTVPVPNNFLFDKKGRLWFDTWIDAATIFCYDLKNKEPVLDKFYLVSIVDGYYETKGFMEQDDSTIWVKGLNVFARYLDREKKFLSVYSGYQNEQSIDYVKVNGLFEDRDRNIWVTTNNNGLYFFNPSEQFFSNIRQINRNNNLPGKGSMMSFAMTKNRTLLAGAWGDGLYRYDSNYRTLPLNIKGIDEKSSPTIWSMTLSPDSNIVWMSAQPGIWAYNQTTNSAIAYDPTLLKGRTLRQIAADKYGNLWIGTQSLGVFKWTAEKGKRKFDDGLKLFSSIPPGQIPKIFIGNNGYVWVTTSNSGIYAIDPATDKIVYHLGTDEPPERKIAGNQVTSVIQYDDSTIVFITNMLYFFNTKKEKIVKVISLPESTTGNISAMERDLKGYIWISMTNGIYRVNPRNEIFIHFDRLDGIANDHFVAGASFRTPRGRIIFGADNQMVIFDPLKVTINDPAPDIIITSFKQMNQPLRVDSLLEKDRIELNPESNSIIIEFSGLGYGRAYISKYKLEGLDKDWITADNSNQAVYSYLPPGNYTFLVKSEDAEGIPSKNITKLVIKVKPPFWKTWWFLGLVTFAAIGLFYWLDKQRTQKIIATESIRTRIATSLTEDMSNSLSSINISSELAKNKIDSDTERTKEYIAQISDASNRMVQSMYDMVWSINPGNDNLPDSIARMKEFAVEIENSHDVSLIFDIDKEVMKLQLDMENRYELLSIFKEAVTNAVRHANARNIQISLRFKSPKLIMMVEDDGKGFEDLQCGLLGRGITDMRRRASAIDASLHIESNENTGSIVKLEMNI